MTRVATRVVAFGRKGSCTTCADPECGLVLLREQGGLWREQWVGACIVVTHQTQEKARATKRGLSTVMRKMKEKRR